jgi:hypothetical protein
LLRRLIAVLSPRSLGSNLIEVHVGFVVHKLTCWDRSSSEYIGIHLSVIISPVLHTYAFTCHGRCLNSVTDTHVR